MKNLNLSLETIKETNIPFLTTSDIATFREDLIDCIIKELDSACEELKDSDIYSLYYETKRHFCTFDFYVNWINISELRDVAIDCLEVNFKNLKK
jgi:hypothetical protein